MARDTVEIWRTPAKHFPARRVLGSMMKLMVACVMLGLVVLSLLVLPLALVLAVFGLFVFWVWMLVDAIRNERLSGWSRVGWAGAIWFTHWIGALLYLIVGRRGRA
ncbi:MAG: hypothetical protein DVB31_11920 [Verrucomicrobia bacterium]|nr:MAG: hypothetical protein DVB31_11920 [Verrucomicrobiota bacterium]